jgi:hypothetical protein
VTATRDAAGRDDATATTGSRQRQARELMMAFADRTGLISGRPPTRYLWTDAFAVCNFLSLGAPTLALQLVDQVHRTLGQHRVDGPARGRLSGLDDQQAKAHPTVAGLRIGKMLPERRVGEPYDEQFEWDRDGQYFHYLTKWMHALDQVSRWTGHARFNVWARELAVAAHRAFTYGPTRGPADQRRMYWKMSVDLSHPLVASMGHHDPLDGYITCVELDAAAARMSISDDGPGLADEAADFAAMIPDDLSTTDPLGLGGLLTDAWRLEQLMAAGAIKDRVLSSRLLDAALAGLARFDPDELAWPASSRLAFRELGLAIGLAGLPLLAAGAVAARHGELARLEPLRSEIEAFWLRSAHQTSATWVDHRDINEVMLATSLVSSGYVTLRGLSGEEG